MTIYTSYYQNERVWRKSENYYDLETALTATANRSLGNSMFWRVTKYRYHENVPVAYFFCGERLMPGSVYDDLTAERDAAREQVAALEAIADDVDGALYWLLNLYHGNSRGGPEYNVTPAEWEEAVEGGKAAHERMRNWRKSQATAATPHALPECAADATHEPGGLSPLSAREGA